MKTIGIANDHAGYALKQKIVEHLQEGGHKVVNFGADTSESVDYPDYAHLLATALINGECECGIAICSSGNGINIAVNKHAGIRAALCWQPEVSSMARSHNDANVCTLPARYISEETACRIVENFLSTPFDGNHHQRRINKIANFENDRHTGLSLLLTLNS